MPNNEQLIKTATGLGIGAVFIALIFFIIVFPVRKEISEVKDELKETEEQLKTDRRLVERAKEILKEYNRERDFMRDILTGDLAPASGHGSPLSWSSNLFEELASATGVSIDNISRAGIARRGSGKGGKEEPPIEEFIVNLDLRADYHSFGRFLARLEERLPYSRLDQINIRPSRNTREGGRKELNIKMQYGIFRFTERALPEDKYPPADPPGGDLEEVSDKTSEDNEK